MELITWFNRSWNFLSSKFWDVSYTKAITQVHDTNALYSTLFGFHMRLDSCSALSLCHSHVLTYLFFPSPVGSLKITFIALVFSLLKIICVFSAVLASRVMYSRSYSCLSFCFVCFLLTLCLEFLGQMVVFFLIRCLSLCYLSYFSDAESAQRFQNMSRVYLDSVPFDGHKCCLFTLSQEWEWTDCGTCCRFWSTIRLRLIWPEAA